MRIVSLTRSLFVASSLLVLAGCATQQDLDLALADVDNLDEQLREARAELARRDLLIKELRLQIERLSALETGERPDWQAAARALANQLRADPLPSGVSGRETNEGFVFDIEGKVLFATGSDQVTDQGKAALRQLAGRIRGSGKPVRVDGHTDNQPLTRTERFRSNLHLSAARALSVASVLIENGVPAERVSVAGFGPYKPKLENSTPEGMAQNRRTEILILRDS